jgi:protein-tyrosine phosphatase
VVDLHSHVLPGLDDGARSLEESLSLLRAAVAEGVTAIAATPHVRADYPTTADEVEAGVARVRAAAGEAGVAASIATGAELDAEHLAHLPDGEVVRLSYCGAGRYALLEFPAGHWPRLLEPALERLRALAIVPVLAHPERNPSIQARPESLRALVEDGALVQVTAASLLGHVGRSSQAAARAILKARLAHLLASDAHGPGTRPYALAAAADELRNPALARHLLEDVPGAVLAGAAVPRAPRVRRLRPLLRKR